MDHRKNCFTGHFHIALLVEPKTGNDLCLAMNGFNAMWSSYNCTDTNFYICKVPPKASDTHCPQGTAQGLNANDCYEYDGGRFSWVNAAAYCEVLQNRRILFSLTFSAGPWRESGDHHECLPKFSLQPASQLDVHRLRSRNEHLLARRCVQRTDAVPLGLERRKADELH